MANYIFIVSCVIYTIIYFNVGIWMIMKLEGFRLSTPLKFIQNEGAYHIITWVFFLTAFISSFWLTWLPWWTGIIIIILLNRAISIFSRNFGLIKYRKALDKLYGSKHTSLEEKESIKEELLKSNSEILDSFRANRGVNRF